jgi:hypothetical protein
MVALVGLVWCVDSVVVLNDLELVSKKIANISIARFLLFISSSKTFINEQDPHS